MLSFSTQINPKTGEKEMVIHVSGKALLYIPQVNKGTAFTEEERRTFALKGKLPYRIETLAEQVDRAYTQYQNAPDDIRKNIYLNDLHDTNQVLFYQLVSEHLAEMLPILYTPVMGTMVKNFSQEFRHPRGLFISYEDRDRLDELLGNRSNPDVQLIVVTDGEGILGIGDQGVGGIDVPIAKLMVYTLCAGVNPLITLPIQLDVGTNNEILLNDPLYLGWRHERISGDAYDEFIEQFVGALQRHFPQGFLHWEDFGRDNARKNLERYRNQYASFNDDIQGTGAVTVSALMAAVEANQETLSDQKIIIYGAGTAGIGIADLITATLVHEGLSEEEARKRFWLLDRQGLLVNTMDDLTDGQKPYARTPEEAEGWCEEGGIITLLDTLHHVRATVLIDTSTQGGAFNQVVCETMAGNVVRPIIFPLSNPTPKSEGRPEDILEFTDGRARIATGSPFAPVDFRGKKVVIAQCNNAFAFPGMGLGMLVSGAERLSDGMSYVAAKTLSEYAPSKKDPDGPLLPPISEARFVAKKIAVALARQACKEGLNRCPIDHDKVEQAVEEAMWEPHYLPFVKPDSDNS